jgi:Na+/pantothenate symporter
MTPALQTYFQAEKKESMLFAAIGILACWIGAALFLEAAAPFYIGLAIPLLAVGIIQIMVGTTIIRRTDQQLEDL